ncbi:MAG: sulfite exporter TauE/SafE family protein [Pseudomonadota bacterium]
MNSTLLTSGMALLFGALHVLEPGHGKTALLSYVVSQRSSWKNSIVISLSSAISHSLAIFSIALATYYIFYQTSLEGSVSYIGNFLSIASGILIFGIGIRLMLSYAKKNIGKTACSCCHHEQNTNTFAWKNSFFTSGILGMAVGIIPCPTIVVVYLASISSGNSVLGIQNVMFFSLGMFISLLSLLTVCSFCGDRLVKRFKINTNCLNWTLIQGLIFIVIGLGVIVYPWTI